MEINEIEIEKLKSLKEKTMMLKDERQKGKITYKIWDIVVVVFVEFIEDIQFMEDKYFKDILSFDGKVDKGSARKKGYLVEDTKPLNVLNVYSDKLQMCIEQEMIEEKTNEITAIPEVINRLNLKNVICTWDALNTQKENVKAVIEKGGDYCVALKANQGNFYKDVQDYFDEDRLMIIQSGYEGGYQLTRKKIIKQ